MKNAFLIVVLVVSLMACASQPDPIESAVPDICAARGTGSYTGYEGGELFECGTLFKLYPSKNVMDAPVILFDSTGAKVTSCGGMPGPVPREPHEKCSIACETENLCQD